MYAIRSYYALTGAVQAERALIHEAIGVNVARVIGARGDARLAARALVVIDQDDAAQVKVAGARVITSYSIHYTKLYEARAKAPGRLVIGRAQAELAMLAPA